MHKDAIEKLKEQGEAIAYFRSLHLDEQNKLWPLLSTGVRRTLELLDAIADEPRTYAELGAIVEAHPTTISQKLNALSEYIAIELGTNTAYAPVAKHGGRPRRLARKHLA